MCRFVQLSALLAMPFLFFGCQAPQTPVPTLGQKLGIPQAFTALRDASRNRTGNRPQREWKPPKKRLADPANLADKIPGTELPMPPAVQVAAKLKVQEDMADQKIKGLKYLGMIGCGCYDKDGEIQAAFLEALEDCTPCVRLAAIEALKATTDTDQCNSQSLGRKERRKEKQQTRFDQQREKCTRGLNLRANCDSCRGAGCRQCTCNCSACAAESFVSSCSCGGYGCEVCGGMPNQTYYGYEGCSSCGGVGCVACMSFESVNTGCSCGGHGCSHCARFKNRRSSMQGFGVCNSCDGAGCTTCGGCGSCLGKDICKRLEKMAYDQDKDGCWIEPLANIRAAAADLLTRCPVFPEEPEPVVTPDKPGPPPETKEEEGPEPEGQESETNGQTTFNSYQHPSRPNSFTFGDTPTTPASYSAGTPQQSTLVKGVVTPYQNREIIIDLEDSYLLPVNSAILIQDSGSGHIYQVIASEVGRLLARPTSQTASPFVERRLVNIGVLAQ